jgi:hypothetical protein
MLYITTKTMAYIFALIIDSVTIFHQDSLHSRALQHEASILEALNAMPADEFRTELRDTLTAFYENILKKTGAGGRPMAKPLIHKFAAKAAPVPDDPPPGQAGANDNAADPPVEPPADAVERPSAASAPTAPEKVAPPTPPAKPAQKASQAGRGGKGRS